MACSRARSTTRKASTQRSDPEEDAAPQSEAQQAQAATQEAVAPAAGRRSMQPAPTQPPQEAAHSRVLIPQAMGLASFGPRGATPVMDTHMFMPLPPGWDLYYDGQGQKDIWMSFTFISYGIQGGQAQKMSLLSWNFINNIKS